MSRPPMTTVARGCCTSAPSPVEMAMGRKPSEATSAVISTGRRRSIQPLMIQWLMSVIPLRLNSSNWLMSTIPLSTTTPNRAIKPTPAEMLKGMPRNHRARIPPMAASGISVNTINISRMLRSVKNRRKRMMINAAGTAIKRRSFASLRFLNCPP